MLKTLLIIIVAFTCGFLANQYLQESSFYNELPAAEVTDAIQQPSESESRIEIHLQRDIGESPEFSVAHIEQLLMNNQTLEAIQLLRAELNKHPTSAQSWRLLVSAHQKLGDYSNLIASWLSYLQYENDSEKREAANAQCRRYLLTLAAKLPADVDAVWLAQQINTLLQLTVDDPELHLAAASLYVAADDAYDAQYHALMAVNNPGTQERAEQILAQLNGGMVADDVTLPLTRYGNQFLVSVTIEGYPARLLLDTGASLTGVSAQYVRQYPTIVKTTKPIRLNTANGSIESYLFTVNQLSLGDAQFNQHIIAQLPLDAGIEFDGLLGVDVLGRFDFVIDQNKAELKLVKRK